MRESEIQKDILDYLYYKPGLFWRNQPNGLMSKRRKATSKHSFNGVSDILGILKGRFIAIEVKTSTGKPSKEQVDFIAQVNALGGKAFIARSIEDVEGELYGSCA